MGKNNTKQTENQIKQGIAVTAAVEFAITPYAMGLGGVAGGIAKFVIPLANIGLTGWDIKNIWQNDSTSEGMKVGSTIYDVAVCAAGTAVGTVATTVAGGVTVGALAIMLGTGVVLAYGSTIFPDEWKEGIGNFVIDVATSLGECGSNIANGVNDFVAQMNELTSVIPDNADLANNEQLQERIKGALGRYGISEDEAQKIIDSPNMFSDNITFGDLFEKALNCISSVAYAAADIQKGSTQTISLNGTKAIRPYTLAENLASPVTLDLNGDGTITSYVLDNYVNFDLNADGFLARAA